MTVKEMANNAADVFGGDNWDRNIYADGYADGANAVLEEIDKALNSSGHPLAMIGAVDKVIEELKGE